MLQFFLLDEGIKLASIGSGRMNLRLDTTDEEFVALTEKMVRAGKRMQEGGWWTEEATVKTTAGVFKALMADAARAWGGRAIAAAVGAVQSLAGAGKGGKSKGM